jgi:tRNA (cmo5U34)-methyltransferase
MKNHSELVKKHFENEYKEYDKLIRNLIPKYEEMHKKVVSLINFPKDEKLVMLDLGIGTGKTALHLFKKFPNAHIKGIDISKNMIEQAKIRLKGYSNKINFEILDMINFIVNPVKFDACVAVLSIHHLNSKQKSELFKKIFNSLKRNGIFVIGDIINFDTKKETKEKEQEWKNFLEKNLIKKEAQYWFDNYKKEDLPDSVNKQLKWLKDAGFKETGCSWQFMNYAVFYGKI